MSQQDEAPIAAEHSRQAGVYVRVSTEEQARDGHGLETQRAHCLEFAQIRGLEVVDIYQDPGISGTLLPAQRPGLARLLGDLERGRFRVMVVPAIDRIARVAAISDAVAQRVRDHGGTIVSRREAFEFDTPTGRFLFRVFSGLAELERDIILERMDDGRTTRSKSDGDRGGAIPYGYQRGVDGIEVNDEEAALVGKIFRYRSTGNLSLRGIVTVLNEEGCLRRGKPWRPSSVSYILNNEDKYRGSQRNESDRCWPVILGEVDPTRGATSNFRKEVQ